MPCAAEWPVGADGLAGMAGIGATGAVGSVAALRIFFAFSSSTRWDYIPKCLLSARRW
jgi:hypothetical protein